MVLPSQSTGNVQLSPDPWLPVIVRGMSERLDAGVASVANRGAVQVPIEGPGGFILDREVGEKGGVDSVSSLRCGLPLRSADLAGMVMSSGVPSVFKG